MKMVVETVIIWLRALEVQLRGFGGTLKADLAVESRRRPLHGYWLVCCVPTLLVEHSNTTRFSNEGC
jgi:hypothetical protein